jgi:DNA-binding CsgD family transcriptional regulator
MQARVLTSRQEKIRGTIAEICARGLPTVDLFGHIAAHVHEAVPYASGGWLGTDPATLLFTGAFVENVERNDCLRFKENELCRADFAKFAQIASSGRRATTLRSETGGDLDRSPRYREIYRPIGVQDEIRTVFQAGESVLGVGCFVRVGAAPHFSAADVRFFESIAGLVGDGLRRSLLVENEASGLREPGMIVLEPDDSVHAITPGAQRLLEEMAVDVGTSFELPSAIYHVARVARRAYRQRAAIHAPLRLRLTSGRWLLIHASPLTVSDDGIARLAIMLEPATRAQLASLIVDLYGLTEREREVTELLVRGLAVKEIATTLSMSLHTARDHIKAVFAKFRVSSRPELTAKLFHDHYARGPASVTQ